MGVHNAVDFPYRVIAQRACHYLLRGSSCAGVARAHQCDSHARLVEHPSQRQMDHTIAKV